jgi:serine/threonine protein kinase
MSERSTTTEIGTAVSLDHGQETWDVLAARIESLVKRWETAETPPVLAEFVPEQPASLRRLVLVELIKVDLDCRFTRKQPKPIEDYVAEFPELAGPSGTPCDLIFEEFQVRRRHGENVNPEEYFQRFPGRIEELSRVLQVDLPTEASLSNRKHPEESVQVGERLDDFDLQALLGEGAFAKVFLAWQRSMQRRVALKVSADQGDEPQTLAQLDHPHIVRVYDQRGIADRNLRLLYMPYLPGGTLHDVLKLLRATPIEMRSGKLLLDAVDAALGKRGEPVPVDSANRQQLAAMTWPEAVCHLGARLAEALDYAHRQGVLHRDIKPANVLLGADASPRLADFNVGACSKLEGASPSAFFGGSIPYMSPEQIEAFNPSHSRGPETLDGRSDLYSLAVTLWELLTGRRPFPDEQLEGDWNETLEALVIRRRAGLDAVTLQSLPANLPPGLRDVLVRCLAADADQRYANAGELARDLDLCLKPAARELIYPTPGWRTWARRHPILAIYPLALLPPALASWFAIEHNRAEIIEPLMRADARNIDEVFRLLQLLVNGTFFPLGTAAFTVYFWPVLCVLRRSGASSVDFAAARKRCLRLGLCIGIICLVANVAAGIVFPVTLHLSVREMTWEFHLHFLLAQTLCGLIGCAYPVIITDFIALRTMFPAMLPTPQLGAADVPLLGRLDRFLNYVLVLAASVPLLSVGVLAGIGSNFRTGMVVLSIAGMIGFALAYWLTVEIRADRHALLELVD